MTFFPQQKRQIDSSTPANHSTVGPGAYFSLDSPAKRENYAPFGSLSRKMAANADGNLGPGQYDISREIIKPSITKYENRNIIIVKINDEGGHQFKSRTNRFKTDSSFTEIGPGTYEAQSNEKKRVKSTSLSNRPKITDKMRLINHQYYEQRRQPTLLSDPPIINEVDSERQGTPKVKGVVNWGLNRKERFDLTAKEKFTDEDKQKALSEAAQSKKNRKIRPSAVFASKSIKSHIETQIYKTNNAFKVQLRKMIDYKDDQPGPGSYEVRSKTHSKKESKFQFFGSTVDRFSDKKGAENLGPGSYQIEHREDRKDNFEYIPIVDRQDRHSYIPRSDHPGPGSYKVEVAKPTSSQSEKQLEHPFGSSHPRVIFESKQGKEDAAEPNFEINALFRERKQKKQEELQMRRQVQENHPHAIFASSSKRFEDSKFSNIEIGCYDVTQNDINVRIQKYQKLVKQLEECQLHKPPFLSSDQRFKPEKPHEQAHKDCWCLVKSVEKQMIDHQSPVFISNERRTTVFEERYKAPPVGSYAREDKGLIKDSFNSRFRKKNENQQKKSQILKKKDAGVSAQPVKSQQVG